MTIDHDITCRVLKHGLNGDSPAKVSIGSLFYPLMRTCAGASASETSASPMP
jgi:hypothetical protein